MDINGQGPFNDLYRKVGRIMGAPGAIGGPKKKPAAKKTKKPSTAKTSTPEAARRGGPPGAIAEPKKTQPAVEAAATASKRIAELESQLVTRIAEAERAEDRVKELEAELAQAKSAQEVSDEPNSELLAQLEGLQNQLASESELTGKLTAELEEMERAHAQELKAKTAEADEAKARAEELETQLASAQPAADGEAKAKLEAEVTELRTKLAEESAARRTAEDSLSQETAARKAAETECEGFKSRGELLLDYAAKVIDETQNRLALESKAAAKLRSQADDLKKANERIAVLEDANGTLANENANLRISQLGQDSRNKELREARDTVAKHNDLCSRLDDFVSWPSGYLSVSGDRDNGYTLTAVKGDLIPENQVSVLRDARQAGKPVWVDIQEGRYGWFQEVEEEVHPKGTADKLRKTETSLTNLNRALANANGKTVRVERGVDGKYKLVVVSANAGEVTRLQTELATAKEQTKKASDAHQAIYNSVKRQAGKHVTVVDEGGGNFKFVAAPDTRSELVNEINATLPQGIGRIVDNGYTVSYEPLAESEPPSSVKAKPHKRVSFGKAFIGTSLGIFLVFAVFAAYKGYLSYFSSEEAAPVASASADDSAPEVPAVTKPSAPEPKETTDPPSPPPEKKTLVCFKANSTNLRRYMYQVDPENFRYQIDPFDRRKLSLGCGDAQILAIPNGDGTHNVTQCDICLPEGYEPDTWVELNEESLRAFTAQGGDPAHYVEPKPLEGQIYGADVMRISKCEDGYPRVWGVSRSRDLTTCKFYLPAVEGEIERH